MHADTDRDHLAAALDVLLELLDTAQRRRSFPDENEGYKQESLKQERLRYKGLRAQLAADEQHGVPVAREFLDYALGVHPTVFDDDEDAELYDLWVAERQHPAPAEAREHVPYIDDSLGFFVLSFLISHGPSYTHEVQQALDADGAGSLDATSVLRTLPMGLVQWDVTTDRWLVSNDSRG
ncbi:hypothetical protein [Agrococcus casei]|uniref:Uncharacterized protein n=1 Tax=Agrococcus casei LMG 22410 TaxID=1255656 RepID=A0A1R4FYM5_9MICO|nr:hypothetical protein [Agrococcus casei]SJM61015.1 hypothetical protein CZ674_07450 [Agrococcus casei LMG 22410]